MTESPPAEDARDERVAGVQRVLMESQDGGERARAHLELARMALADGGVDLAIRHLRESIHLDQRLDAARQLLGEIGEPSGAKPRGGRRLSSIRALLHRLRRR
ncbi:MAG: hypothetical protein GXP62_05480 [Oligoflexia bacterium]|nr:hypothetical protein [Oligoflexia bacterium]